MRIEDNGGQRDWTTDQDHELLIDRKNRFLPSGLDLASMRGFIAPAMSIDFNAQRTTKEIIQYVKQVFRR